MEKVSYMFETQKRIIFLFYALRPCNNSPVIPSVSTGGYNMFDTTSLFKVFFIVTLRFYLRLHTHDQTLVSINKFRRVFFIRTWFKNLINESEETSRKFLTNYEVCFVDALLFSSWDERDGRGAGYDAGERTDGCFHTKREFVVKSKRKFGSKPRLEKLHHNNFLMVEVISLTEF